MRPWQRGHADLCMLCMLTWARPVPGVKIGGWGAPQFSTVLSGVPDIPAGAAAHFALPGPAVASVLSPGPEHLQAACWRLERFFLRFIHPIHRCLNCCCRCFWSVLSGCLPAPRSAGSFSLSHLSRCLHCRRRCFWSLEAPPARVCGYDTPFPLVFEPLYLPTARRVADAILRTVAAT